MINKCLKFLQNGEYQKAISCIKEILTQEPTNAILWHNLGYIYYELEDLDNATTAIKKAININPNLSIAWTELSSILNVSSSVISSNAF